MPDDSTGQVGSPTHIAHLGAVMGEGGLAKVKILFCLRERRMTSAEISRRLEADRSGVHRHLGRLLDIGYVTRHETERKWVYWSLTRDGEEVVESLTEAQNSN